MNALVVERRHGVVERAKVRDHRVQDHAVVPIQVGSVMVDTSIKTKLKKLEKNMLEI